ncbi:MAG: hypothetical protein RBR97_15315 [Bacteroidales bacterium]|nr:hypothetical protein [Bacteroidales bacterium]
MKPIILLFIGLILSGCSSMNIPAKLNTPSFEKKGQMEVELGSSTNSFYQNVGYSITDNLSIISSGFISYDFLDKNEYAKYRWSGEYFEFLPSPYESKYIDLAIGMYKNRNETIKSIYVGTGLGNSNYRYKYSSDGSQEYLRKNTYNTIFAQFNYGKKKNNIDYGLTSRLSYSYYPFNSKILNSNSLNDDIKSNVVYHIFGVQPCLYLNITKNRFVYTFNAGTYLTNYNKYSDWFVRDYPQNTLIHLSIGLKYKIGKE